MQDALQETLITTIVVAYERDVVVARQQARTIADLAGFDNQDQIRIATAVSELARNIIHYAKAGKVIVEGDLRPGMTGLAFIVQDSGPGIKDVNLILDGRYISPTGMGKGIVGTRRLMDEFSIQTAKESGTSIRIVKRLPKRAQPLTREKIASIREELKKQVPQDPLYELQRQNQELMRTLEELRSRQEELALLNNELEATNRGVVALYAELDERATYLRKVSELKTRFFSNMSHEFRTPLNSIRTLAGMLLERLDGPLEPDQEKQIKYIQHAAEELGALIDDLLDLAKAEAGRLTIRPGKFDVTSIFDVLRGLLKPLTQGASVALVFDEPPDEIEIYSDEGKVSQILRNFISNALKFTLEGEVRVAARADESGCVIFSVSDTGLGISPENMDLVFEEFSQVENVVQAKVKGTGLGLPLSRKLADLLGGKVWAVSEPGKGSTFYLSLPTHPNSTGCGEDAPQSEMRRVRVLVIDDDDIARYVLQSQFSKLGYSVEIADGGAKGLEAAATGPDVIFLDLSMPDVNGTEVLDRLQAKSQTRSIPVVINTSMLLTETQIANLKERGAFAVLSKGENFLENATNKLHLAVGNRTQEGSA